MKKVAIVLAVVLCCSAVYSTRTRLDPLNERETLMDMAYLPNGKMLKWISAGMDNVLSDVLWLRSMRYVMSHFSGDRDYTYLYRVYDIMTDFDPNFVKAYRFGAYFLTGVTDEYDNAISLLEKGWENNPDSWELAYELGSIYNINLKSPEKAAEWFARAAENPYCPSMIREHATVLYEEEGRLEHALAMWSSIHKNSQEGSLKDVAEWNVKRVRSLMIASKLAEAVDAFGQTKGHLPSSLQEMTEAGIIRFVPVDGFDEEYLYIVKAGTFHIESRELLRREIDKRIVYITRFILEPYRRENGTYPDKLEKIPPVPYDVTLEYDPETGKISYDHSLRELGDRSK